MDVASMAPVFHGCVHPGEHIECATENRLSVETEDESENSDHLCASFLELLNHYNDERKRTLTVSADA
jgi:hypothetical protein